MSYLFIQNLSEILKELCSLQNSKSTSIVPWIALVVSIVSLIVSITNIFITRNDKKIQNVNESVADLLGLLENPIVNDQWQELKNGGYISDEHQKLEIKILGYLGNSDKDKHLKKAVKRIREAKPKHNNEIKNIKHNIENKLKEWRGEKD